MDPSIEIHDLIERYLSNELSGKELAEFNSKMSSDAAFKKQVEAHRIVNHAIIDREMINLKQRMQRDFNDRGPSTNWTKIIGIVSAVIISGAVGYFIINKNDSAAVKNNHQENRPLANNNEKVNTSNEVTSTTNISKSDLPKNNLTKENKVSDSNNEVLLANTNPTEEVKDTKAKDYSDVFVSAKQEEYPMTPIAEEKKKVNCNEVKIVAEAKVHYANNEATVIIDKLSIKGGTAPYTYSLDDEFFAGNSFSPVKDGTYHIHIKDYNNCISEVSKVVVKIPAKEINDKFAPGRGETWRFPLDGKSDGTIKIVNKTGSIVYSASISGGNPEEWDGRSNNGVDLETGNYYFEIHFTGNEIVKGHITIMR